MDFAREADETSRTAGKKDNGDTRYPDTRSVRWNWRPKENVLEKATQRMIIHLCFTKGKSNGTNIRVKFYSRA